MFYFEINFLLERKDWFQIDSSSPPFCTLIICLGNENTFDIKKRHSWPYILVIKVPEDSKVIDSTTDAGKEELKARKANDDAYEDHILSIEGDTKEGRVAFGIVKGCKTRAHRR